MSTDLITKHSLDLTAENPDNLVLGEEHELTAANNDGDNRVFVPNYGGFYTKSVKLRDADGDSLDAYDDYVATFLYEEATTRSGYEVCGAIVITNPNVNGPVSMDYQAVGGGYTVSTTALEQVLEGLEETDQPVEWANIVGKPDYYPPGGHLHALWELYGFETLNEQLERITQAIIAGDQAAMDNIRDYAKSLFEEAQDYTDSLRQEFEDFKDRTDNPHGVTKDQVELGQVENYPMASRSQARAMESNEHYMSPERVGDIMADHAESGDHDDRYVRKNGDGLSLRENNGQLEARIEGTWRVIWPAQWA